MRKGRKVSFGRSWRLLAFERRAEIFKRRDVDFLHIGDVRDAGIRQCHALGDPPAQPDHLDLLDRGVAPAGRRVSRVPDLWRSNASRSSWVMRPAGPVPVT